VLAERRLTESEERFRTVFEKAVTGIAIADFEGRFEQCNPAYQRIVGYSEEELRGLRFPSLIHPDDRAENLREVKRLIAGDAPYLELENRYVRSDGTEVYAHKLVSVLHTDDGRPGRLLALVTDVTERRRLDALLRESEERFRLTFELAPVGVAHVGLDGRYLRVNEALATIAGRPRAELEQLRFQEITHPDDLAADLRGHRRLLLGEVTSYSLDKRYLRPDGSSVWISLTVSLMRTADQSPAYFVAMIEDITERKLAEQRMRESEHFTRRVLDNLFAFVGVLTPHGTVMEANQAPLEAAGIGIDEVLGRRFWDCYWWNYSPEMQAQMREWVHRAAAGETIRQDVVVRTAGDTRTWIDFKLAPLRDEQGRVTHLIPSAMDVQARKDSEAALASSEARLRAIFSSIDEGFALCEMVLDDRGRPIDHRFLEVNPQFEAMTGLADPIGKSARADLVPGLEQHWTDIYARVAFGREPVRFEERSEAMGRSFDVFATPVETPGRFALVFKDVTERHRAEEALRRAADLEHGIARQLQQALLPERLATAENLDLAARYVAAGEMLEVGGDWYDSVALPDGRILLTVGDVVGHNLDAAVVMGRLRSGLAALATREHRPGPLLDALDALAAGDERGRYTTVCCAVIDPGTGMVEYASAGHPPMLVIEPDGATRWLDGGRSTPLCTLPVSARPQATTRLAPGSVLVLYSDGLIDHRRRPLSAGLEALRTAASRMAGLPVEMLPSRLIDDLTEPAHVDDDIVVLAIRYTPSPSAAFAHTFPARPDELSQLRAALRSWLEPLELDGRARQDLLLAVGEASTNAIEHAYDGSPGGRVRVDVTMGAGELQVAIRDWGTWRPPEGSNRGGGRGTAIMQRLGRDFTRTTSAEGTVVTLRLPLDGQEVR
jgi:PAS domain S-box-containing protein